MCFLPWVSAGQHRRIWCNVTSCWGNRAESHSWEGRQPESKALRVSSFVLAPSQLPFLKGQKWSKFISGLDRKRRNGTLNKLKSSSWISSEGSMTRHLPNKSAFSYEDKWGVTSVAQCVKDLTAVAGVAVEAWVQSQAWHSVWRILHCCSCCVGCNYSSDSIPGPGTSICHWCSQKKKKAQWISDLMMTLKSLHRSPKCCAILLNHSFILSGKMFHIKCRELLKMRVKKSWAVEPNRLELEFVFHFLLNVCISFLASITRV